MKKALVTLAMLVAILLPAEAQVSIMGFERTDQGYKYEFSVGAGFAYYKDHYDLETGGYYIQTSVAAFGDYEIDFGAIMPASTEHLNRTRPMFSLVYAYKHLELGPYIAVSPYGAYGFLVGVRF